MNLNGIGNGFKSDLLGHLKHYDEIRRLNVVVVNKAGEQKKKKKKKWPHLTYQPVKELLGPQWRR